MRFTLQLGLKQGKVLPLNYQYELSSWIYKVISRADSEFATWLHSNGYTTGSKQFRLFNFSRLQVPAFEIQGDRLHIKSDKISLQVSFGIDASAEKFIMGLFQHQQLTIGDTQSRVTFEVLQIEAQDSRLYSNTCRFRTISPMCASKKREYNGKQSALYLSPEDEEFERILTGNLVNKWMALRVNQLVPHIAFASDNSAIQFRLLNKPSSRLVTFKAGTEEQTKVRGFDFQFELTAPIELMELGYNCGFGEKNSEGFGMVEVVGIEPEL
jgi:CRISPR-associated endoribonuclease Cas6